VQYYWYPNMIEYLPAISPPSSGLLAIPLQDQVPILLRELFKYWLMQP
jgi:hypothetical protein